MTTKTILKTAIPAGLIVAGVFACKSKSGTEPTPVVPVDQFAQAKLDCAAKTHVDSAYVWNANTNKCDATFIGDPKAGLKTEFRVAFDSAGKITYFRNNFEAMAPFRSFDDSVNAGRETADSYLRNAPATAKFIPFANDLLRICIELQK